MTELTVALHGEVVGALTGTGRAFDFTPTREALHRWGLNSRVLLVAVPLVPRPSRSTRGHRRNFFEELLPEGDARERLANEAGVRKEDVIGMLAHYGRDVAGAIQIWDAEASGEPREPRIEPLTDEGVRRMLDDVAVAPLGNRPRGGKTSLNGVQSKIVLVRQDGGWARAIDGWPSTHIVKPIVRSRPSMIFDEEYGARFARALDLADFTTELMTFDGAASLVIERYDRDSDSSDGRIHQEDFNQVLGLSGDQKYEVYGHRGVTDIARVVGAEDAGRVLRMLVLSVAAGNLDLHMKNLSLIHHGNGGVRLASMYDVVPQHFYDDADGEMALQIGGEYEHRRLTRAHLERAGAQLGVADATEVVDEVLRTVEQVASAERPHAAAHPGLQGMIEGMAMHLAAGRTPAGDAPGAADTARPRPGIGGWRWDDPPMPGPAG